MAKNKKRAKAGNMTPETPSKATTPTTVTAPEQAQQPAAPAATPSATLEETAQALKVGQCARWDGQQWTLLDEPDPRNQAPGTEISGTQSPAAPDQGEAVIRVPISAELENPHVFKHVELRLTGRQGETITRIWQELSSRGERVMRRHCDERGRIVDCAADVVRWLLDQAGRSEQSEQSEVAQA